MEKSVVLDKDDDAICDVLAIRRAERYSPNSVDKDSAVLESVCRILRSEGMTVSTVSEDDLLTDGYDACGPHDIYVSMGRHKETMRFLKERQAEGRTVVNSPEGVALCCNRKLLTDRLKTAGMPLPPDEGSHGYWLKRACGVAENNGDVRYAATHDEMTALRKQMADEGTDEVVVQAHVEGDLIKFYGVDGQNFFRVFYPGDDGQWKFGDEQRNGAPHHYDFSLQDLQQAAEQSADVAGIGVYGGDAIVRPDGSFVIIDFNDWPSFSRCRDDAAEAIAAHIIYIYSRQK